MMRNSWMYLVLGGALALGAGNVRAQGEPGADGPPPPPMGGSMELMGFEGMHGGKAVKGAPFSATSNSETTQTLGDGTVIRRTSTGALYRDSEGRSRREISFNGAGPLAAEGGGHNMISISDPVAGAHYMLNPEKKIAHKMTFHAHTGTGANADKAEAFHQKMQAREQEEIASGFLKTESLGHADGQRGERGGHSHHAHHRRRKNRQRQSHSGGLRALVLARLADGSEEHAHRSAIWDDHVLLDKYSESWPAATLFAVQRITP